MKFEDRLQLTYDKGERYFEDKLVLDATVDDLDIKQVKEYVQRIGYSKTPLEFLKQNNGFVIEKEGEIMCKHRCDTLVWKSASEIFFHVLECVLSDMKA